MVTPSGDGNDPEVAIARIACPLRLDFRVAIPSIPKGQGVRAAYRERQDPTSEEMNHSQADEGPATARDDGPRVNQFIDAREVLLIDAAGEKRGVVPTHEALKLAEESGLDLVEVSPNAKPPVCKILTTEIQVSGPEEGRRSAQEPEGHRDQGDQDAPEHRHARL